jgi:probable HAF family extracellular repeat protein
MTDLGTLGGPFSFAWAINSRGQVVGTSRTASFVDSLYRKTDVFLWQDGNLTDIGRYGWDGAGYGDINPRLNDRGQVVWFEKGRGSVLWDGKATTRLPFAVSAMNNGGQLVGIRAGQAVLWESGNLRTLGALPGDSYASPDAINDGGAVVGTSYPSARAFLWQRGVMRDLGSLPGLEECYAGAINAKGQVLGYCTTGKPYRHHAFLWDRGAMRDLGDRGAAALNDRGQVAGVMRVDGGTHAFLWQDGKVHDLGTLGGRRAHVTGINNGGQVIGSSYTREGRLHAFVWADGVMADLGRSGPHSTSEPLAINDAGQIVGWSQIGKPPIDNFGSPPQHAVLWVYAGS